MKTSNKHFSFKQKLLVIAVLAAFGPAQAQDDEVAKLIKPDRTIVSVGGAVVSGDRNDRTLFGQYSSWSKESSGLLLDFEFIQRDDATGTWMNAEGRNLGLDSRELKFSREKQGDWKYTLDYNEMVRHDPRTVNTSLVGLGSTSPTVNALAVPGTGTNQNLELKRQSYTLGTEKWVNPNLMLEASFKSEKKEGSRLSGIGGYCSNIISGYSCSSTMGALLMIPEPVNSTTHQLDVKANFLGKNYNVTAGFYGSLYQNDNSSMRINPITGNLYSLGNVAFSPASGVNTLGGLLTQPVALAPDNQSYQLSLSGNYAFSPSTRANFNLASTHSTQNESYAASGLAVGAGLPGSLNGVVNSTLAQLGLTARPMPKLSLLGNIRYEKIEDQTPQVKYDGVYTNLPNSSEKANSKAEATYQLPENYRATVGVDFAWVKRSVPAVGSNALYFPATSLTSIRESTTELTYRAELRKAMSETVNGAIAYMESSRKGSHWLNLGATNATYPSTYQPMRDADVYSATGVFPTTMMDRKRDKVRLMLDWMATDKLSLQFSLEDGKDTYSAPTATGLHSTKMNTVGVDAAYTLSDNWKTTGYFNYGNQSVQVDHSAGYIANIKDTSQSAGFGVVGKLSSKIDVGADLSYLYDVNSYGLGSGNTQAAGVLPDVTYRTVTLKLFGKYALDTKSDIRVDLSYQNLSFNEWTWSNAGVPFAYSDNSTVSMQPNQTATYLGVKYVYRFK